MGKRGFREGASPVPRLSRATVQFSQLGTPHVALGAGATGMAKTHRPCLQGAHCLPVVTVQGDRGVMAVCIEVIPM